MIFFRKLLLYFIMPLGVLGIIFFISVNAYIHHVSQNFIFTKNFISQPSSVGIVLGAMVWSDGRLSDILKDRAKTAVELYKERKIQKILVSGDNGSIYYDELTPTYKWLLSQGVEKENIYLDYAGFDTFDTMYRAKHIFGVSQAIVITQEFHLPRAVYLCKKIGIDCYGAIADHQDYVKEKYYYKRESLANIKAFFDIFFHAQPAYLGETIDMSKPQNI